MPEPDRPILLKLYGAMAASVILQCLPVPALQLAGMALMTAALAGAYVLRARRAPQSLAHNHLTFLIRTVWIGGLFLAVGFAGACAWFYAVGDHAAIENLTAAVLDGARVGPEQVRAALESYKDANLRLLIIASVFAAAPAVLYVWLRLIRGAARAARGYRMADPARWI